MEENGGKGGKWGKMENGGKWGGNGVKWTKMEDIKNNGTTSNNATYTSKNGNTIDSGCWNCAIETERHISLVGALLRVIPLVGAHTSTLKRFFLRHRKCVAR